MICQLFKRVPACKAHHQVLLLDCLLPEGGDFVLFSAISTVPRIPPDTLYGGAQ